MDIGSYYHFRTNWLKGEIACHCGCGLVIADREFIALLSYAREVANFTFPITSWCRCKDHNFKVGGSSDSAHLKGLGVDIGFRDGLLRYKIIQALSSVGIKRIGVGLDFIHADVDTSKSYQGMWLYKHKGGMVKWSKKTELGQSIDRLNVSLRLSGGLKTSSRMKELQQYVINR